MIPGIPHSMAEYRASVVRARLFQKPKHASQRRRYSQVPPLISRVAQEKYRQAFLKRSNQAEFMKEALREGGIDLFLKAKFPEEYPAWSSKQKQEQFQEFIESW